ncbi:asparagine synthase (glutamine-hydrolysing) [Prauserella shujinwangii]|uniref:Asparagine synthase (Glutamine-hydrolysing) n=1 Tax=Prauserella shujinwangii TaxID=1453103 RepID=A0A2T0LQQ4_9PSEU|nr:asparagine synthase-related protein [Prauserella shujinwangii]PRX45630.1 asparagine synthase (glutamine-hydrolysing) [Prauserella shujinwangii]
MSGTRTAYSVYTMDPLEIAGGWLAGYERVPMPEPPPGGARRALDRLLLPHLTRTPCLVAFSGGRDSSVLLAAAVALARREGLPLPVPITLRYPQAPGTDEADWQRAVLDHLGLRDRVVLTVHDEHDPVGPIATPVLLRHGVVWSPNFAPTWRMLDHARGGSLLTGEGGDELFGLKRITPVTKVLKSRGRVDPRVLPHAIRALAPAPLRRRAVARGRYSRPWLREPVERLLARRDAADAAAWTLHAGRNAWQFTDRRCARRAYDTMRALGAEIGAGYVQAFAEPELVAAVAGAAGFWGWTGRTATMRALFGDLLPRAVLERSTKAVFTDAVFTGHTREFARGWTGAGVDPELVDAEALRANWLSAEPHAPAMALLQSAWLADRRGW